MILPHHLAPKMPRRYPEVGERAKTNEVSAPKISPQRIFQAQPPCPPISGFILLSHYNIKKESKLFFLLTRLFFYRNRSAARTRASSFNIRRVAIIVNTTFTNGIADHIVRYHEIPSNSPFEGENSTPSRGRWWTSKGS